VCTDCSAGSYNEATGVTVCTDCSAGKYGTTAGATTSAACTDCDPHTVSSSGSSTCLACEAGTYQPSAGSESCESRNELRCWKAKDQKTPAFAAQDDVSASDEVVASDTIDIKSPAMFCSPAGFGAEPVSNPDAPMCCYKESGAKLASPVSVEVTGAHLGTVQLAVGKQALVCSQCGGSASTEQSLRCYKVKDLKNPAFSALDSLAVTDGLATDSVKVSKPALYCAPVALGAAAVTDSTAHQCCYKATGPALSATSIIDAISLDGSTLHLGVSKQSMVCEPCTRTVLP